jgi:hypothetical protein
VPGIGGDAWFGLVMLANCTGHWNGGGGGGADLDMRHETSGGGGTNDDSCTYGGVLSIVSIGRREYCSE